MNTSAAIGVEAKRPGTMPGSTVIGRAMLGRRLREFLRYDARWLHAPMAYSGLLAGSALWRAGRVDAALGMLTRTHSAAFSEGVSATITTRVQRELNGAATGNRMREACDRFVRTYGKELSPSLQDPRRMLGSRILVLKSPREHERGVILLGYSYVFPLFARLFDVEAIARRYHIVLEPSWCGFCSLDLLCFTRYDFPIFVECWEPRDAKFLAGLQSNFVAVPVADNWWVDHRVVKPDPSVRKDADVIMIAAWAPFKRHWRFFEVLRDLRNQGHRPKVLLVGYGAEHSREEVVNDARRFGVLDQIEWHDGVTLDNVVHLLARSKVHLLWSRREGANRAHVEAMFADVPVILREGFNFGYRQPHINAATGVYASEENLAEQLLRLIADHRQYAPREWAMANMTCQKATGILNDAIRQRTCTLGERWTTDLAVKTVRVNTQDYWNPEDRRRFEPDFAFLESHIKS
jgi:glycosyltransferase involved in cell wall biosynthesis